MNPYNQIYHIVKNQIVKRPVLPDCRQCVNYIPYSKNSVPAISEVLDKCSKFQESIGLSRTDETKCGNIGQQFIKK